MWTFLSYLFLTFQQVECSDKKNTLSTTVQPTYFAATFNSNTGPSQRNDLD